MYEQDIHEFHVCIVVSDSTHIIVLSKAAST